MATKDNQPIPNISIEFGIDKETKQDDVISSKAKVGDFTPIAKQELLKDIKYLSKNKPEVWESMKPLILDIEKNRRAFNNTEEPELKDDYFKKNISNYQTLQSMVVANEGLWNKTKNLWEESNVGLNKGFTELLGFPMDASNMLMYFGEQKAREALAGAGFDVETENYEPYFSSDNPIMGSKAIQNFYNDLGIRTEYDKSRASTAFVGRVSQELGLTLPIIAVPGLSMAKGAINPGKVVAGETALSLTSGIFAATAQASGASPMGEAYASMAGYLTPLAMYKVFPKQSIKDAASVIFTPNKAARNSATTILANALLKDNKITQVQFEGIINKLAAGDSTFFGKTYPKQGEGAFPALLNDIVDSPGMEALQKVILAAEDGGAFFNQLQGIKTQQNAMLEIAFLNRLDEITKSGNAAKLSMTDITSEFPVLKDYYKMRLTLAEDTAGQIISKLGDQVNPEQATMILQRELNEALFDARNMEKVAHSNLKVLPTSSVDEIKSGFQSIINNQLNVSDGANIPSVIANVAGKTQTKTVKNRFRPDDTIEETISIMDNIDPKNTTTEILSLKNHLYDLKNKEIRKGANANVDKINAIEDAIGVVDNSIINGYRSTDQSLLDVNNALDFTNNLRVNFYDNPEIGGVLGYNNLSGDMAAVNQQKIEKLMNKQTVNTVEEVLDGTSEGVKQKILQDLTGLADDSNQITNATLNAFLKKNSALLDSYPDLKNQITDLKEANKLISDVKSKGGDFGVSLNQLQSNRAKLLLDTAVDQGDLTFKGILENAFKQSTDKKNATFESYLNLVQDDVIALTGLQNEVTDFMMNTIKTKKIKGGTIDAKPQVVMDLSETSKFIDGNQDVLLKIYGEEGLATINEMNTVLFNIEKVINNPGQYAGLIDNLKGNNLFVSSIGRIAGSNIAGMTGGPALVFASIGGRLANNFISGKSVGETMLILQKAFTDPQFAAELLQPVNKILMKEKEQLINGYLASVTDLVKVPAPVRASEIALPEEQSAPINVEKPAEVEGSSINNTNIIMPNIPNQNQNMNPNMLAAGQSVFGQDDPVFSGIMDTNVGKQRVA